MRYLTKFAVFFFCYIFAVLFSVNTFASRGLMTSEYEQYFPQTLQAWKGESSLFNVQNPTIIEGWTDDYIKANTGTGNTDGSTFPVLYIGFDSIANTSQAIKNSSCSEGLGCGISPDLTQVEASKAPTPAPILSIPSPLPNVSLSVNNSDAPCSDASLCHTETIGDTVNLYIDVDLSSLSISVYSGSSKLNVILSGERYVGTISLESNGKTTLIFDDNLELTTDSMSWGSNAIISAGSNVLLKVISRFEINAAPTLATLNPIFYYAPTGTISISATSGGDFYGCLLAKNVQLNNGVTVNGAITTLNYLDSTGSTITGNGSCVASIPDPNPPTTYTLDVTPDNQFALLCQAPEMTFTVYNDDGSVATDYDGTITATFPDGLTPSTPIVGTQNSEYVYTPNQGEVVVPVKSATLQEYTINAELTDDSDAKDSGQVLFGPYQFSADPVKAVAGHPTQFDVQVLACKNDQVTPVQGYNGDKDLTITDVTLTKPTINQGAIDGGLEVSDTESGSYSNSDVTLNFSDDAKSQAYLRYNESGSLNFTLTDPEFVCPTEYDGCEVTNDDGTSENITSLQGIVNVDVRPWTFAICSPTNQDMSGDSDGGTGFIAAGEKFNLEVKPIVWQNGGSLTTDIDVSNYCNANVTQNFLLSNAQPATVLMASTLATPTQGRLGSGVQTDEGGSLEREHDAVLNSGDDYYTYAGLTWQEVGSLNITADSTDNYLDMNINQGYREIGRFYPHHFKLENDNSWHYASGLNGFAYMNQPIAMDYQVKAKSAADSDTENYGYFVDKLKASLMIEAIEKSVVFGTTVEGDSLSERFIVGDNQSLNNWNKATYKFNSNDFMFLKDHSTNSPYTTTPDGPYDSDNSIFGVAVDPSNSTFSNDDNVNFDQDFVDTSTFKAINGLDELGVEFFSQPDFRYGRMVLDAVSSPIGGPVSVPLRVEYWDNTNFVVNSDDSGSRFKADVYYVMSNINGSLAKLSGSNASSFNTVSSGKSSVLQAKQDSAERETVRLFLRQSNSASGYGNNPEPAADNKLNATVAGWKNAENIEQPWLQFNWRNKGDEDPSTVVTFGAYRGNDRIIFRGEELLTEN